MVTRCWAQPPFANPSILNDVMHNASYNVCIMSSGNVYVVCWRTARPIVEKLVLEKASPGYAKRSSALPIEIDPVAIDRFARLLR
jgi:hypothetical protein